MRAEPGEGRSLINAMVLGLPLVPTLVAGRITGKSFNDTNEVRGAADKWAAASGGDGAKTAAAERPLGVAAAQCDLVSTKSGAPLTPAPLDISSLSPRLSWIPTRPGAADALAAKQKMAAKP